jgi:tRNA (guanine-N(7)-)-methyltransferase subunit TRM82
MPKRPNSICLTLDDETILCADKFGDLYSLPLIPKSTPEKEQSPATPPPQSPTAAAPQPFKPSANELTVHLKRNRMALQNQLLAKATAQPKETPNFEHSLLLGHVSMVTGVLTLKDPTTGRPYILTADRDEHIRVSRGVLSQAYIIDHFCFGHEDFISRICAVPGRPELLLSAGGDDEAFLWNWTTGALLSKENVLSQVSKLSPGADKIAVSGLFAHALTDGGEDAIWVFVCCER